MNKAPNLSVRKSRPQSLGGAFGGLLRLFGVRASDADLAARWHEIMGAELAGQATLYGLSKGTGVKKTGRTLIVKAINPAGALALSYRKDDIIKAVNKYFGYAAIDKITIKK
ncbi:MAG: DUF721 domain-containing protein [Alphaproteobacteria bacterium]|nr:DUF721 domain-containing protein [Alphaproteobacteria bacterium]